MSAAIKRLRAQAKKLPPSDALSEWTVPVLPSDLNALLRKYDSLGLAKAYPNYPLVSPKRS